MTIKVIGEAFPCREPLQSQIHGPQVRQLRCPPPSRRQSGAPGRSGATGRQLQNEDRSLWQNKPVDKVFASLGKVNGVKLRQRGENKVKTPCAKPVKQLSGDACIECKTDIFSGYCFRNRSASPRTKSFPRVQRSPRRISPSPRPTR